MPFLHSYPITHSEYCNSKKTELIEYDSFSSNKFTRLSEVEGDLNETLFKSYLLDYQNNTIHKIELKISSIFDQGKISQEVYQTSVDILQNLPESVLLKIDLENLYETDYGTLVIDWQLTSKDNEFSLEIGNKCMGYFSELSNGSNFIVDEVNSSTEEIITLNSSIENFYLSHQS